MAVRFWCFRKSLSKHRHFRLVSSRADTNRENKASETSKMNDPPKKLSFKEQIEAAHLGFAHDLREINRTKGKVIKTSEILPPTKKLADLNVKDIEGKEVSLQSHIATFHNKICIMSIQFSQFARMQSDEWRKPLLISHPEVSYVQVCIIEGLLWAPFHNLIRKRLRKTIHSDQEASTTFLHFGRPESFYESIGIKNRLTNYIYVIDSNLCIRWKSSGAPEDGDIEKLNQSIDNLLEGRDISENDGKKLPKVWEIGHSSKPIQALQDS